MGQTKDGPFGRIAWADIRQIVDPFEDKRRA